MDIKKYSSSYGGTQENFVIINNGNKTLEVNQTEYSVFCVMQNILQRGMPTAPSMYLQRTLGRLDNLSPLFLISDELLSWNKIKGDTANADYPAETFFYEILPSALGENAFLRNLIIPEADFSEILQHETVFEGQQVDFFFPRLRTVFEIDGYSHDLTVQNNKDHERDKELAKEGIRVIRIKTLDIKQRSGALENTMKDFVQDVIKSKDIAQYVKDIHVDRTDIRVRYDAVMRLQLFLLDCLLGGRLNLHDSIWSIRIRKSDIPGVEELLLTAYEDLKIWMTSLFGLLKYSISFPELNVTVDTTAGTLDLDFGMFNRYSDVTCSDDNCIYVRTDYFPAHEYNYYKVACSETLQYVLSPESAAEDDNHLTFLMQNLFFFPEFREGQLPIIKNVLERRDTIGILPTGTGKSMCYQLASLLQPGVSIVVVPLISLMKDQKRAMDRKGIIHTEYISSIKGGAKNGAILQSFGQGQYQLLWISPERFQNEKFRDELLNINKTMNFALAVIDEVHCLSEWGHDFRVSYLTLIRILREYCPQACLLGLTATASQAVLEDLKVEFENDGSGIKALPSMERRELIFVREMVRSNSERYALIDKILSENDRIYVDSTGREKKRIGLLFTPTVGGRYTGCKDIYDIIKRMPAFNDRVSMYYADLPGKDQIQNDFMDDKYSLLVCTKAFGMGIDKENIKYTVHISMPQSIESFYQEAGRAGRADKEIPAYCYIIYQPEHEDIKNMIEQIFEASTSVDERRELADHLSGDLGTIMYFWNSNHKSLEEDYSNIKEVLSLLYKGNDFLRFNKIKYYPKKGESSGNGGGVDCLDVIQDVLYKLSLLGIVGDWTINYDSLSAGTVNVTYNGCDAASVYENLLRYIRKYDSEFKIDVEVSRYKKYYDLAHNSDKPITQYIKILIEWANDNILYNRLQSTYNMLNLCSPSVTDEEFRRRINDFFAYTEDTVWLEDMIYKPLEYRTWFILLKQKENDAEHEHIISKEKAAQVLASLQRYLESYRYNTGFNYLSGVLRLLCGQFQKSEGEWRLDESLQSIKESLDPVQQNEIIEETLHIAQGLSLDNKDSLSRLLIKHFPEKSRYIYSCLQDRYSLFVELDKHVTKFKKLLEDM